MSVKDDRNIQNIAAREGFEINEVTSLAGGSINEVFLLNTSEGKKVVKINSLSAFPGMFSAEKAGLEVLKKSGSIDVPEVFGLGQIDDTAYLILEYKKEAPQKSHFWDLFGQELAGLHKNSSEKFGFEDDNYIGSLPQYNGRETSAADFYIRQRLEPQLRMASKNGFSFGHLDRIFKNISEAIPGEPPALIHGDLWGGNYITNEEGLPCLIDPAVSFGPREMDLAMMKLFGGFPEKVFSAYDENFPLQQGFEDRVPLWQLYYLLVHLNIFGSSYLGGVKRILKSFS
ncbi:MAG: fructosamine kinase family protein [Salinimicrobium sp.]